MQLKAFNLSIESIHKLHLLNMHFLQNNLAESRQVFHKAIQNRCQQS